MGIHTTARQRFMLALTGALMVAIVGSSAALIACEDNKGAVHGPLAPPDGLSDAVGARVEIGVPYSWGGVSLTNRGDEPVTLDDITLVGDPPSIHVIGQYAVPSSPVGFLEGYSPEGRAVKNLTIPPGDTFQVVIGVTADRPGSYLATAVRVRYHANDQPFEEMYQQSLRLCAPFCAYTKCTNVATPPA
jgi:hypothetical protein